MHVQIHFKDARNKRVDVSHLLKLDWTQTGLQTFGGETTVDAQLILKPADFINSNENDAKIADEIISNEMRGKTPTCEIENQTVSVSPVEEVDEEKFECIHESPPPPVQYEYSNKQSESSCSGSESTSPSVLSNPLRFNLSPSNFISTDAAATLPSSKEAEVASTSVCFDDLMLNFCSLNEFNTPNAKSQKDVAVKSASLDTLLNLRPKSILPPVVQPATAPSTKLASLNKQLVQSNEIVKADIVKSNLGAVGDTTATAKLFNNKNSINSAISQAKPHIQTFSSASLNSLAKLKQGQVTITGTTNPKLINSNEITHKVASPNQNKRMVIYKVDSSDLKAKETLNEQVGVSKLSLALTGPIGKLQTPLLPPYSPLDSKLHIKQNLITSSNNMNVSAQESSLNSKKLKLTATQLTRIKSSSNISELTSNSDMPGPVDPTQQMLGDHSCLTKRKFNETSFNVVSSSSGLEMNKKLKQIIVIKPTNTLMQQQQPPKCDEANKSVPNVDITKKVFNESR